MRRDVLPADVKQDPANSDSAKAPATPADAADASAEANTAQDAAQADDAGYVPVTGRSRKDVEHMRECEALVSAKTASDYEHVVLAYGVLWAIFAAYGMFLWRRSAVLRRDLEDVRRQVARGRS